MGGEMFNRTKRLNLIMRNHTAKLNRVKPFTKLRLIGAAFGISLSLGLNGCSSTATTPTKFESFLFEQHTNPMPQIVFQTNVLTVIKEVPVTNQVTITRTNEQNIVIPTFSNYVTTVQVPVFQTNVVQGTNFVPVISQTAGAGSNAVTSIGAVAGDLFGVGGLVKAGLGAVFAGFLTWRNRQFAVNSAVQAASVAQTTAETFAQNIETLLTVLKTTPQGQKLEPLIKNYLMTHQKEAGVIDNVASIIDSSVSEGAAKTSAETILNALKALQG